MCNSKTNSEHCYSSKNTAHRTHRLLLALLIIISLANSSIVMAQSPECEFISTPTSDSLYSLAVAASRDYNENNPSRGVTNVPVAFITSRDDNGQYSGHNVASIDTYIASSLGYLNDFYQPAGLNFFQLGDVNAIHISQAENEPQIPLDVFCYFPNALNVLIPSKYTGGGWGTRPYIALKDNFVLLGPGHLNVLSKLNNFPHEVGHVYALEHTFRHFEDDDGNLELVIRVEDLSKQFKQPNWDKAGDLLEDTHADCRGLNNCATTSKPCSYNNQPDWTDSKYDGSYLDANGDMLIENEQRERNIMSYFDCTYEFTPNQIDLITMTNDTYRKNQFSAQNIDVEDYIEFEGTDIKLKNIIVKLVFPEVNSLLNYSQDFTNFTGRFQFAKLDNIVNAHVKNATEKIYSPAMNVYDFIPYTTKHWKDSLDIFDVIAIQKYIGYPGSQFGQGTLANGYKILAADVNDDGIINETDFIMIQQLLVGKITSFQPFTQPWRFVPEFISQGNFGFINWPFDRTIHGSFVSKADYTKPEYEYTINNGLNGKAGFDGVKIGNTIHTPDFTEHPGTQKINSTSDILLYADVTYKVNLSVDASGFSALQQGIHVKNGIVENNNVSTSSFIPYLDSISFNYNSEENQLNLVWTDLSTIYDSMMIYEFEFTPTITSPSLDSFFIIGEQTIPSFIVDSAGSVISGNFTLTIMDLDTNDMRSTKENNPTGAMRMAVYPNPAMDKIYVILESGRGEAGKVLAYDIQVISPHSLVSMRKHGVMNARNETIELDVSTLPNGIWYVQVSGLDNTITKSIVIQH